MKIYHAKNGWQYWYDPSPGQRIWWAAKFDAEGNQINDAINSHQKSEIIEMARD